MGLDITAYEKVTLDPGINDAEACDELWKETEAPVWLNPEAYPIASRAGGLTKGAYRTSGNAHGFRAGSYSGYNRWREYLAAVVGTTPAAEWRKDDDAGGPFFELIHFSDCEGVIGGSVAAKLAADFETYRAKAHAYGATLGSDAGWFVERYEDWAKAFQLASRGGCVRFH